jgi:CheY-like chemotaxis protein
MRVRESKNILIADDDSNSRVKMANILLTGGHKVNFATNEREIIERLNDNSLCIDLLILDLQSSNINGFSVLKWIRDNNRVDDPQVLLVAGTYDSGLVLNQLKELGVKELLTKGMGVTPEHFFFRVNRVLFHDRGDGRSIARVLTDIPVEFSHSNRVLSGEILNISEDGVFISTEEHLETGNILSMKFILLKDDGDIEIETEGEVMWGDESGEGQKLLNGVGIQFSNISAKDRTAIASFVEEEIRKVY